MVCRYIDRISVTLTVYIMAIKECATCGTGIDNCGPSWARQCDRCFKDPATKRNCRVCSAPRLLASDPVWKDVCGRCFVASGNRPCVICEGSIPAVEPTWKTVCKNCYSDKSKWRTCDKCDELKIRPSTGWHINLCSECHRAERQQRASVIHCETWGNVKVN